MARPLRGYAAVLRFPPPRLFELLAVRGALRGSQLVGQVLSFAQQRWQRAQSIYAATEAVYIRAP